MLYVCRRSALTIALATLVGIACSSIAEAQLVMGTGPATNGVVRVFDPMTGADRSFEPYPGFRGGIRVAMGDLNGDGVLDIITAPGPGGGPHVVAFDGTNLSMLASFLAYAPTFTGGVFVAAGDVNGDGKCRHHHGRGARRRPARRGLQRRGPRAAGQLLRVRANLRRRRVGRRGGRQRRREGRHHYGRRARRRSARRRLQRRRPVDAGELLRLRSPVRRRRERRGRRRGRRWQGRHHHRARGRRRPARQGVQRRDRRANWPASSPTTRRSRAASWSRRAISTRTARSM